MLSNDLTITGVQAEHILSQWIGTRVKCTGVVPLEGGMVNTALSLHFDRAPFTAVAKLNRNREDSGLRNERSRLEYLRAKTSLPVPEVYAEGNGDEALPFSYLLLETIAGTNMTQVTLRGEDLAIVERELAGVLLALHGRKRETFGRIDERGTSSWTEFFVPELVANRATASGNLPSEVLDQVDEALETSRVVLEDQGKPTLTHGDIWAGNIMVAEGTDGWHLSGLVDPSATKYTDVECELAYLEVFNTVGTAFFDTYTASLPLRSGYRLRRMFYWLNTYLVHVSLFEDRSYRERAAETARDILLYTR